MKLTEKINEDNRVWDSIELKLEYGYFASNPPISITFYSDGMLMFTTEKRIGIRSLEKAVEDREHTVSKKSLVKLDGLVNEIAEIECLEGSLIYDGPSFDCYVHLSNGTVTGFHYVSMLLSEKHENLETSLMKILREEFFLKKYKEAFEF